MSNGTLILKSHFKKLNVILRRCVLHLNSFESVTDCYDVRLNQVKYVAAIRSFVSVL